MKEKELEVIDGKEAVARANLLRQREREQLAREQESLGIKAEGKRIDVENLSEKALEQDDANDIAERTGGNTDRDSQQHTEREKNRQVELMEQVHGQFRVAGAKFLSRISRARSPSRTRANAWCRPRMMIAWQRLWQQWPKPKAGRRLKFRASRLSA